MKLWGGRFRHQTAAEMEEFNSSIQFDHRLWQEDIDGSLAHVKMLAAVGVLSAAEADTIGRGLAEIRAEIEQGQFDFSPELEDIHMHIEHRLMEKIGPVGGKVHTARSRNDQVDVYKRQGPHRDRLSPLLRWHGNHRDRKAVSEHCISMQQDL